MSGVRTIRNALLGSVILCSISAAPAAAAGETIQVGGTGGALAAMKIVAAEYRKDHPGVTITVLPSLGSGGGIRAVLAGALDVGVSSRPLRDGEKTASMQVIGRTPFVFVVRKPAPVSDLTVREIEDFYAGRKQNWPDGRPIRVVFRPHEEFDTRMLKSISPEMERSVTEALAREGMIIAVNDQDNAQAIKTIPGALGTITLAQILNEELPFTVLSVNGIRPGPDPLSVKAYPYFKTYYLVSMPGARKAVREFVAFLSSSRGRAILARCGYQDVP